MNLSPMRLLSEAQRRDGVSNHDIVSGQLSYPHPKTCPLCFNGFLSARPGSLCFLTHQEAQREKAPVFLFPLRFLQDCTLNKIMEMQKEAFPPWGGLVRLFFFSQLCKNTYFIPSLGPGSL